MKKNKEFILIKKSIFPVDILITTAKDKDLYKYIEKKKLYKLTDEEKKHLIFTGNGKMIQLLGKQIIIRLLKKKTSIGVDLVDLVHEISHAVFCVFQYIGISHTDDTDEVFAYYQGYLVRDFLNQIKK